MADIPVKVEWEDGKPTAYIKLEDLPEQALEVVRAHYAEINTVQDGVRHLTPEERARVEEHALEGESEEVREPEPLDLDEAPATGTGVPPEVAGELGEGFG